MEVKKVFNEFIIVEEVVVETKSEGGIIYKSPTIAEVLDDIKNAQMNKREQKLFMPDVRFKVLMVDEKNRLELEEGDVISASSTGLKLNNYRVLRDYDIICKL